MQYRLKLSGLDEEDEERKQEQPMNHCPKCSSFDIRGPRYVKDGHGNEGLRFECFRCGYAELKPTDDAEKRQ